MVSLIRDTRDRVDAGNVSPFPVAHRECWFESSLGNIMGISSVAERVVSK